MLREYVVFLLEDRFPGPMQLAQSLVDKYTLSAFLESPDLQRRLLHSWLPHQHAIHPRELAIDNENGSIFSHRWYLQKFLITLKRAIDHKQLHQLARIHSMLIDITDKQHAQLRLFLENYDSYLMWQHEFCYQQYQIAFKPLVH